jgi:hypothetical protein
LPFGDALGFAELESAPWHRGPQLA